MMGELASQRIWSRRQAWFRSFVAVLCISLVLLGGMLSATHWHKTMGGSHPDCGLCVVAHTAIQTGTPALQVFVVQVVTQVEVTPEAPELSSISLDPLFSRPPPADLTRA